MTSLVEVTEMLFRLRAAECCESYYLIRNRKHRFKQVKNSHFAGSMFIGILKKLKRQQRSELPPSPRGPI